MSNATTPAKHGASQGNPSISPACPGKSGRGPTTRVTQCSGSSRHSNPICRDISMYGLGCGPKIGR